MPVRILLVEDHELLAQSLTVTLAADGVQVLRPVSADVDDVLAAAKERGALDLVLLDLHLGAEGTTVPLITPLRDLGHQVVMLTGETDEISLAECIEAGAVGLIPKSVSFDEMLTAVRHAAAGHALLSEHRRHQLLADLRAQRAAVAERLAAFERLTPKERHVLGALMAGKSADTIAAESFVSTTTVRSQIRAVLSKLGVNSQLGAVAAARDAGWEG